MGTTISAYQLPLLPQPQTLQVLLLGVTYSLRTRWSVSQNCWCLDIADQDNNALVGSIPIVTGADLLEQYGYLEIGGGLYVFNTQGAPDTVPGFSNLGTTALLLFIPYA